MKREKGYYWGISTLNSGHWTSGMLDQSIGKHVGLYSGFGSRIQGLGGR